MCVLLRSGTLGFLWRFAQKAANWPPAPKALTPLVVQQSESTVLMALETPSRLDRCYAPEPIAAEQSVGKRGAYAFPHPSRPTAPRLDL